MPFNVFILWSALQKTTMLVITTLYLHVSLPWTYHKYVLCVSSGLDYCNIDIPGLYASIPVLHSILQLDKALKTWERVVSSSQPSLETCLSHLPPCPQLPGQCLVLVLRSQHLEVSTEGHTIFHHMPPAYLPSLNLPPARLGHLPRTVITNNNGNSPKGLCSFPLQCVSVWSMCSQRTVCLPHWDPGKCSSLTT